METHRKWLLEPPTAPPRMEDYGFDEEYKPLTKSETNAFLEFLYICVRDCIEYLQPCEEVHKLLLEDLDYKGIFQQHLLPEEVDRTVMQYTRCSKDFLHLLHQTQTYRVALRHWEAYQSWKTNRNPARAALEVKCGIDAKNASHAIRLLEMGKEILMEGVVIVNRKKTKGWADLMAIRNGDRSYDYVMARAQELQDEMEGLYKTTTLRNEVSNEYLNNLCVELVEEYGW